MAQGRHVSRRRSRALIIVASVVGVLVLTAGGAAYSAYRYEQARADTILPGVVIEGVDVGGMTRQEAVGAVRSAALVRLSEPLSVKAGGKTWQVTPRELGHRAAAVAAVNKALSLSDGMGTFSRFWHRFRSEPLDQQIPLAYAGNSRVDSFLGQVAEDVAVKPVNAAVGYEDGDLAFVKPHPGRALDFTAAARSMRAALRSETSDRIALRTLKVAPKITSENLGPTIVVRLDQNKLYLYDGFRVERTFSVATAKPGYTTPTGNWTIYNKAENPTWYNPALDGWGADLPAVIPGGPGNPMGTRALYLTAPGLIRIHGTTDPASIGRYASHGCIRMQNAEVEELYAMVPIGTHVIVTGSRPAGAQEWDTPATADI
jgi:lipoprotein-anchoring transpeptidase ErfK/SrfK